MSKQRILENLARKPCIKKMNFTKPIVAQYEKKTQKI